MQLGIVVTILAVGVASLVATISVAGARAEDEGAVHLIDEGEDALELARGWARTAHDPDVDVGDRAKARQEAARYLELARARLQEALSRDPQRSGAIDPLLKETLRLLSAIRRTSSVAGHGKPPSGNPPSTEGAPSPPPPLPRPDSGKPPADVGPERGEPAVQPPRTATAISWEEWLDAYAEITERPDATSAARHDELVRFASGRVVEYRAKIVDVVPAPSYGEGAVIVQTCTIFSGKPVRTFVVRPAERASVSAWKRWDRLSWLERIEVNADLTVEYTAVYDSVRDLTRTPNPGISYPPDVRKIAPAATWLTNLRQIAEPLLRRDWQRAFRSLRRTATHEYSIPGRVVSVSEAEVEAQPEGDLAFVTRDRARRFGPPVGTVRVVITDPQVRAALAVGTSIRLGLSVESPPSPAALHDAGGRMTYAWRFLRLSDSSSRGR